jgi:DNA-binding NarL/FixJ family response regulator
MRAASEDASERDGQIRILLAEGRSLFREAVTALLERQSDLHVASVAWTGLQAVSEAERTKPDLALLATDLQDCDFLQATTAIRQQVPQCRLLVLAKTDDQETLFRSIEAGASAYIPPDYHLPQLVDAARAVHRGESVIPGRLLGELLAHLVDRRHDKDGASRLIRRLTKRERQVLALLSEGGSNQTIAEALSMSPETARTHIQNIIEKFEVHSRLEAAALVARTGILSELVDESS